MDLLQLRRCALIAIVISATVIMATLTVVDTPWKTTAFHSTLHDIWRTASFGRYLPSQCHAVIEKTRQAMDVKLLTNTSVVKEPPWFNLMATHASYVRASSSDKNQSVQSKSGSLNEAHLKQLYVRASGAAERRLGNQLFNYASLIGVAWRNRRIPLWPATPTQVNNGFHLRIPLDVNDLEHVSSSRLTNNKCIVECSEFTNSPIWYDYHNIMFLVLSHASVVAKAML